jgi:hypothetical protein
MQNKADMTHNAKDIITLRNKCIRTFAHTWKNIGFVHQAVVQLPSIEAIERELMGFDGGDA